MRRAADPAAGSSTSLAAILILTFLASLGTGVLWAGVAFIAKHDYGYSAEMNYALFLVTALTYIAGAFASGPLTRALERRLSLRTVLGLVLLIQGAAALLPLATGHDGALWLAVCTISLTAALLWPIVESYLTAGRHGRAMRSVMGWWNIAWTGAVAAALLLMAPLVAMELTWLAIVALAPLNLLCLLTLPFFAAQPSEHDEVQWRASVTDEYPLLLRSARVLLPLSYLLIGAVSPLMPYRLADLHVEAITETPATATWMIARVAAIALMWPLRFWHGRWGTLLLGGAAMTAGFAVVVLSPNLAGLLIGLAALGAGQGVVYYAALYYAMSVGRAAVDAGGTHEGLIGVGYAGGPLAALIGLSWLPRLGVAGEHGGIVGVVTAVMALAVIPAISPYTEALRRRGEQGVHRGEGAPDRD